MQPLYDYKKYVVLYVDDEEKSLKYFTRAFQEHFRILTAPSAQEGLKLLEAHKDEIALLMTDQRMPGEKGVWLLEKARQLRPRIIRILATAYSDMEAAIAAVNTGAIYKYVTKPWDPPQLENTIKRGLEFFMVQHERDQLLREKMSVLHNMMIADRVVRTREETWQDTTPEGKPARRTMGIANLGGATLDNEENYLIKKLLTALGVVQVENQARI